MKKLLIISMALVAIAGIALTSGSAQACSCYVTEVDVSCSGAARMLEWDFGFCPPPMTFKIERRSTSTDWVTIATNHDKLTYVDGLTPGSGIKAFPHGSLQYRVSCESCNPCAPVESNWINCP